MHIATKGPATTFQPDKAEGRDEAKTGAKGLCVWEHSGVSESAATFDELERTVGGLVMPSATNGMVGENDSMIKT